MNKLFLFFFILFAANLTAQSDFSEVDAHALNFSKKGNNLNQIADGLARPFQTETEIARAFFIWIADNIRYDYKTSVNPKEIRITYRTEAEHQQKLAALRKKQLDRTLRLKKGICEDYALLFKTLCGKVGIESKIIIGHARTNPGAIGRLPAQNDHAWNAVNLEGRWFLLDPTWGAGTVDNRGNFEKDLRTEYFKVLPEVFIKSHFPEDKDMQFLVDSKSPRVLGNSPLAGFAYLKYGVVEHFPESGILDSRRKEVIRFHLKLTEKIDGRIILFENNRGQEIKVLKDKNEISFDYPIKNKRGKTLTLAVVKNTDVLEIISYKVK